MHRSLGLKAPTADADEAEAANHLLHVVVSPHARDLESIQEVCSAQELQLWGHFCGRKEAVIEQEAWTARYESVSKHRTIMELLMTWIQIYLTKLIVALIDSYVKWNREASINIDAIMLTW